MDTTFTLVALIAAGLAGGLIRGLLIPRPYEVSLPFASKKHKLGFLGDLLVGAAASVALYSVLAAITGNSKGETLEILRIVSLGLIAGYAGRPVLDKLSDQMTRKLDHLDKVVQDTAKDAEVLNYLRISDINYDRQQYELAIHYCDKVLQLDSCNSEAMLNKARALDKRGETNIAVDLCREVLKEHPNDARAHYNLACYLLSLNSPKEKIYQHLTCAFDAFPLYKENAKTDQDFETLREDPHFIELSGIKEY